jgi:hypothetical protein
MPLIDASYFVGELNIPDTSNQDTLERLNFFIAKYEEELLRCVLGHGLYAAYKAGIQPADADQKWKDIRDGKDYTGQDGRAFYWMGLTKDSTKQSLIACYVYYWWMRDKASHTASIGETRANADGGERVSPGIKMARAWNEMARWAFDLFHFLNTNESSYPEWTNQDRAAIYKQFKSINVLNV